MGRVLRGTARALLAPNGSELQKVEEPPIQFEMSDRRSTVRWLLLSESPDWRTKRSRQLSSVNKRGARRGRGES